MKVVDNKNGYGFRSAFVRGIVYFENEQLSEVNLERPGPGNSERWRAMTMKEALFFVTKGAVCRLHNVFHRNKTRNG